MPFVQLIPQIASPTPSPHQNLLRSASRLSRWRRQRRDPAHAAEEPRASDGSPPGATSSTGHALLDARRFSPAAAASWSATSWRPVPAAPAAATDCPGCTQLRPATAAPGWPGSGGKKAASSRPGAPQQDRPPRLRLLKRQEVSPEEVDGCVYASVVGEGEGAGTLQATKQLWFPGLICFIRFIVGNAPAGLRGCFWKPKVAPGRKLPLFMCDAKVRQLNEKPDLSSHDFSSVAASRHLPLGNDPRVQPFSARPCWRIAPAAPRLATTKQNLVIKSDTRGSKGEA